MKHLIATVSAIAWSDSGAAQSPIPSESRIIDEGFSCQQVTTFAKDMPLPGYAGLAAYFNIDNGAARIRGIFAAGNLAAMPKLTEWLSPFGPMGAASVVASRNDGSDQQAFTEVGLPAFQSVQDPLDYRFAHYTQLDTFDHIRPDEQRQSAVILATVPIKASDADKPLPA